MRKPLHLLVLLFIVPALYAQKKPLDHTVYDGWQTIGDRMISRDGKWVVFNINVQEGDNQLVIRSSDAAYQKTIARGENAVITTDSRYLVFRIKPLYKDTRDARIKKKRPDDMPKDTLAVIELGKDSIWKKPRVRGFKSPDKGYGWIAYQMEKSPDAPARARAVTTDTRKLDSLGRIIDSLQGVIKSISSKTKKRNDAEEGFDDQFMPDAEGDEVSSSAAADAGSDLVLRNLENGEERVFRHVLDYQFSDKGNKLLIEQARNPKDSLSKAMVLFFDLRKGFADTLSRGGNDFKNFAISEDGSQAAYLAERDAKPKDLQRFYKLWYYREGMDSATMIVDKTTEGMQLGYSVSEYGAVVFSKNGKRVFFGTSPIQPSKDTSLVELDLVKLDLWHYKDDYLQTTQLARLQRDLQQNYMAVYHIDSKTMAQLGSEEIPVVYRTDEGNGELFIGVTDFGKRIESQWTGNTLKDIYSIQVKNGSRKLVKANLNGVITPAYASPSGRHILWYDFKEKDYFVWNGDSVTNLTARIKVPLYDEEHDSPSDPFPYGIMRWQEDEKFVYLYDRFSIWKVDVTSKQAEHLVNGRTTRKSYRYLQVDPDEQGIKPGQTLVLRYFNHNTKEEGFGEYRWTNGKYELVPVSADSSVPIGTPVKARNSDQYLFTKETYVRSPDLYVAYAQEATASTNGHGSYPSGIKLSAINPQQSEYIWGTAELYKWKTFSGKSSEGILYRPENFDPSKKYPLILYFYEKLSDGLNSYIPPAPTPSRLNISFFVSRGYLVFAPNISYTIGHPARSAYDFIVSAAKDLTRHKWVDSKNIGIQGQSWGGIQVAQLITMTDMFKAAWAGAPVANMTSAYGGIRWESGLTRQFQYEKTQSRIGATLWEKPELYIESSPLFHLPKVKTPLVIMANDADGAVPWYQGIELFTGMRRLGKQVWMLNYNGEAHNLVQRKNRKDIQVREQQYFDWLLKGEKPARWITDGIPAVKKGKDWGLD